MAKTLNEIKHGNRVYDELVIRGPLFHKDIEDITSLDAATTRKVIAALYNHGYIIKDNKGRWTVQGA